MNPSVRLGIVGWGVAGRLMASAAGRRNDVEVRAVVDPDETRRREARSDIGAQAFQTIEELGESGGIDAIYIAAPTEHHASSIASAAEMGAQVIVEKPIAADLTEALEACQAAEKLGVKVIVGSTHSNDAPIRALRSVVESGELGDLLAVSSTCYTDWTRRSRSAGDLDLARGGGPVLRQGAHQLDILRYVGGGAVESVYATTFGGESGAETGFSAILSFAGGRVATAHYSGAGGFDSRFQAQGIGELGEAMSAVTPDEQTYFRFAGSGAGASPTFGCTVATFSDGEVLVTPYGLLKWRGRESTAVRLDASAVSGWDAVLVELHAAMQGATPVRTGRWGTATLEACLAVHESHRGRSPVPLRHQVPTGQELVPTPIAKELL